MKEQKLEVLMQSKNLVETSYNITAVQNRVFYHCLFAAQKEKTGELCCTVKLDDIRRLIPNPNQKTLVNIKKMFKVFKDTSLLFDKEDEGELIECDYNLIAGSEYNTKRQEFKIFFMERLYNHILSYTNYAPLNLEIMAKYTSFYSQRLYEALRMWSRTDKTVTHIFKLETLRFILGVGDKYPEYKNLKQRVLNQALKEINAAGNMEVSISEIKEGKRVSKIEFTIYDKEPKTYFKDKKDNVDIAAESAPIYTKEIETEEEIENYVQYEDDGFMKQNIRRMFLRYCYADSITFSDISISAVYKSAKEVYQFKKSKDKVDNLNDYKYFLGVFANKLEDDINQFVAMTRMIYN